MSVCVTVDAGGFVVQAAQLPDLSQCYGVLLSGAEYRALIAPEFASLGITPEQVLSVAGWGFAAVLAGWMLGLGTHWAVAAIRRL